MILHKDVEIGEHKYRVHRLPARIGSWVANLGLREMLGKISEDEFLNIQGHLLKACSVLIDTAEVPILLPDGDYSPKAKHLEYDLEALNALQKEVRDFNFHDFFAKKLREIEALVRSSTSGSTTT